MNLARIGCWPVAVFVASSAVLSGCGRLGFDAASRDDVLTDAMAETATSSWDLGPYDPPSVIAALSLSDHEHAGSMTGDLLEVFFESRLSGNDDIWQATRSAPDAPWNPPMRVAELSSLDIDSAASVSNDGLAIWFTRGTLLYESTRPSRTAPWRAGQKSPLNALANGQLYSASPTASLLAMVVQTKRPGGADSDLFLTTRASLSEPWGQLAPLDGINTEMNELKGFLSDDLCSLYFASDRPGGAGSFDLYFATRASPTGRFRVELVAELADREFDGDPWVSPDGHRIMFASYRDSVQGMALYEARR